MAHAHAHPHAHARAHGDADDRGLRRLAAVLVLVVLYMVAEVVGGVWSGSLALLADAGHMLSDAAALGLALFAGWLARRPRTPRRTFGWHRTEILAALVNGATLVAVAILVLVEAFERLDAPTAVDGRTVLWVATGGLAVNLVSLAVLHGGRDGSLTESLNLRGAWLHVLTDALGSVEAIAAGALVWAFGWYWADPVASVLIALLVVYSAYALLREAVHVLMEGTPRHVDVREVRAAIAGVPGVDDVHDLHVWTITSGFDALSVHARVGDRDPDDALAEIRELLRRRFAIDHSTVQLEREPGCHDGRCPD